FKIPGCAFQGGAFQDSRLCIPRRSISRFQALHSKAQHIKIPGCAFQGGAFQDYKLQVPRIRLSEMPVLEFWNAYLGMPLLES
ncbi:MAG TPA: hypothetical protein PKM58_10290, partial [Pyrinomonadaceae bacterium]|nr:hypothetical protein [Pyrinomonadaceae bacterium]